jgi:hypothetical protein
MQSCIQLLCQALRLRAYEPGFRLQDVPGFVALFLVIHAELQGWLACCKVKGKEGKTAYHMQSMEALFEVAGSGSFCRVSFNRSNCVRDHRAHCIILCILQIDHMALIAV